MMNPNLIISKEYVMNPMLIDLGIKAAMGAGAGIEELIRRRNGGAGGNYLTGYPGQEKRFDRFTPQQQQLQGQGIQQALALLQGNPSNLATNSFAPIAQQARKQFNEQTIPSLAERFTAMGDGQKSSAFQGALGEAASGLEQGLAAQQSGHNMNLLQLLLGLGIQPSFENAYIPGQPGLLHGAAQGYGESLGSKGLQNSLQSSSLFKLLSSLGSSNQGTYSPNVLGGQ